MPSHKEVHTRLLGLNGGTWFSFEPHLRALYSRVLGPGGIALDGGANTGLHTIEMAAAVSPGGLVIAVEPLPGARQQLQARLSARGLAGDMVRVIPDGLWNAAGAADFFEVLDPAQHELSGLRNRHWIQHLPVQTIRVQLTTIDAICRDLAKLDFLKLDLEGAEMDALHGGRRTMEKFRPVISFEQDQFSPRYFGYTWDDLQGYFDSLDYEVHDLFGLRYSQGSHFEDCKVWDFVGLPAEYANKQALLDAVQQSMRDSGVRLLDATEIRGIPDSASSAVEVEWYLDYINSVSFPAFRECVSLRGCQEVVFEGWAVDRTNRMAVQAIDICVDQTWFRAEYGLERGDVATHLNDTAYLHCGFQLKVPARRLAKGPHTVLLRALSGNVAISCPGPVVRFTLE